MALWALAAGSIASGLLGASASKSAASAQAKAANQAAEAQLTAARESNELQRQMFNTNLSMTEPLWQSGVTNQAAVDYALGTGARPDTRSFTYPNALTGANAGNGVIEARYSGGGSSPMEFTPGVSRAAEESGFGSGLVAAAMKHRNAFSDRSKSIFDTGSAGSGGSTTYRVGDNSFGSLEEAQAYLKSQPPQQESFTPEYNGYAPMKEYFAGLRDLDNFRASPDYQFRQTEGTDAMREAAAAGGLRLSGDTLRSVGQYSSNLADNEYTDYFNRGAGEYYNWLNALRGQAATLPSTTSSITNMGTNYAGAVGNTNASAASNAGNALISAGNAKASGYEGMANAFNSGVQNLSSLWMMKNMGMFS